MNDDLPGLVGVGAAGPPAALALFARFAGSWRVANELFSEATGAWSSSALEWRFAVILDGRGVQDVLVDAAGAAIGTTVRTWSEADGWRIVWFSPRSPEHCVVEVVEGGDEVIRLEGVQRDGRRIRWVFDGIRDDAFDWNGWCSDDGGDTWWHEQRMRVERIPPAVAAAPSADASAADLG